MVQVRFSLVVLLAVLPLLGGRLMAPLLLSVALHEAGHLIYLRLIKSPIERVEFSPGGVGIDTPAGRLTPGQTVLLNLAGPGMNILAAAVAALLLRGMAGMRFAAVSLAVGLVNLIPLGNTDGMALLEAVALLLWAPEKAERRIRRARIFFGGGVLLLLAAACIRDGWRWYYLLGVYYFAAALVEERGALWYHNKIK